jgi:AraC-like DNA-binding protein
MFLRFMKMDRNDLCMKISDFYQKESPFSSQVFRARIFRRDPRQRTAGGLTVVYGGCEHCAADYRIDRQGFPYWCLEFVVAGRGTLAVGKNISRILEPGVIFSYGPGTAYQMESDADRPLVKYFVDFTGPRAVSLLRKTGLRAGTDAHVFPPGPVAEAFDRLIDAGLDSAPRAPRRAALLLESLLLGCADWRVPKGASQSGAFTTYRRLRDMIDGLAPTDPILRSVAATARFCHVDSAHLCRLFRRFARITPYRHLMRRRLEAATARLSRPGCLVKEVSEEFGFADPYHFSRVFKSFHGMAPASFIKIHSGRRRA